MAHAGHPLIGDALYGGPMTMGLARQALHAFRLELVHPITQESMRFETPINAVYAPDILALLERLHLEAGLAHAEQRG